MGPGAAAVPTYALDTLRRALRSPAPWTLLGLGLALAWAGRHLGILALESRPGARSEGVLLATAQAVTLLGVLWVLARTLGQDEASELAVAADCTRPGPVGRRLGRAVGAATVGTLVGAATLLPWAATGTTWGSALSMYCAIIVLAGMAAAWGMVAVALGGAALVLPLVLLLWLAGHLPWGTASLLPGAAGRAVSALLPGPVPAEEALARMPGAALVCLGLAVLALAAGVFRPRAGARARRPADAG